ncbi:MAG: polyphosphate polymerase domain-containing protein [Patiriisocius sp.]
MEQNMGKAASKQADLKEQNSLRFERKFIYKNTRAEDLIQTEILTNPFCFKEVYHRRSINNIYFDDHDLTFYKQNVSGDGEREKYRLRWYNDVFSEIVSPTFEIKKKMGEVGDKYSFKMKDTQFSLKNHSLKEIQETLQQTMEDQNNLILATKLKSTQPAIFNSYERRYFLSNCKKYRITIDYNMCFYNPNTFNFATSKITTDDIVLEFKYAIPQDTQSREVSQHFSARLSKNSKYVTGIETVYN